MLNQLAVDQREQFYSEHGAFVTLPEGIILFEDGAIDENSTTGLGRLIPPPDKYERAQLRCKYFGMVAEQATRQFEAFRDYLKGTGKREDAWCTLYTDEDRLEHLTYLQVQAKRARAKYSKAKLAVKEHTPFYLVERARQEIEDQARKHEFLQSVEDITL